jgi:hypothetical protein
MSEITREELAAFTDASTKSAVALEKVSTYLEAISENQGKLIDGMAKVVEDKIQNSSISRDIEHTKWLVGIIGFAIIIVSVVIKFMDVGPINDNGKMIKENSAMIQTLLKDHNDGHLKVNGGQVGEPIRRDLQPQ